MIKFRTKKISCMIVNIFCYMMTFENLSVFEKNQNGRHKNQRNIRFGCATFSNLTINDIL